MNIKRLILGPVSTNCYVFCDTERGKALVIDPAESADVIADTAKNDGCEIEKVILTHGHYDHTDGLSELLKLAPGATVYAHEKSSYVLNDSSVSRSRKIGDDFEAVVPDKTVEDGDIIPFGSFEFKVIYTPGHTIDSMCLMLDDMIFCGDTVFRHSIGRTDMPTGSFEQEIQSIKTKLMPLDDNIMLYPGHGESTSVGEERRNNPFIA